MSFFSIPVIALICVGALLYFVFPMRYRWCILMLCSFVVVFAVNPVKSALFVCLSIAVVYLCSRIIEKTQGFFSNVFFVLGIVFCVLSVGLIKTFSWATSIGTILIAPVGISYYLFSTLGYLIDVKRGICESEKNPFKFFLFASFFPCLVSGPIIRYTDVKDSLFEGHRFDLRRIVYGVERIIWGIFKKFVVSDRMAVIVNTVFTNYSDCSGLYILLGILLFPVQLYADFSGCIDIIMGIAEVFGVVLPENFDMPFASKTVAEFWRKWHISMGQWLRDYVFYSLLRCGLFKAINKRLSMKMNRKKSMQLLTWAALFITWVCIGIWHGGSATSIFGVGIFFGVVIIFGEMVEPLAKKVRERLKINQDSFGYGIFQSVRTFFLFAVGNSFFRQHAGLKAGFEMWVGIITNNSADLYGAESFLALGLDVPEWIALILSMTVIVMAGIIRTKTETNLRVWLSKKSPVVYYGVWLMIIIMIVLWGWYGEGYTSQAFIYQQF